MRSFHETIVGSGARSASELASRKRQCGLRPSASRLQEVGSSDVAIGPQRLTLLARPGQPQPAEVAADALGEFLGRALRVRIVEAQPERAAGLAGEQPVEQRGAHVANVQAPGGARRKADGDRHGSGLSREAKVAATYKRRPQELKRGPLLLP